MIGGSLLTSGLVGSWTPPGGGEARRVYFLEGGINGSVVFPGMGLVEIGAEPKAGIETMLAEDEEAAELAQSCAEVGRVMREAAEEMQNAK